MCVVMYRLASDSTSVTMSTALTIVTATHTHTRATQSRVRSRVRTAGRDRKRAWARTDGATQRLDLDPFILGLGVRVKHAELAQERSRHAARAAEVPESRVSKACVNVWRQQRREKINGVARTLVALHTPTPRRHQHRS